MFPSLFHEIRESEFTCPHFDFLDKPEFSLPTELRNALADPIDYPPIGQSVFPGDSVAIVLQDEIPQAKKLTTLLIEELVEHQIASSDISIVVSLRTAKKLKLPLPSPKVDGEESPPELLNVTFGANEVALQVHDQSNSAGLSYLVANPDGEAVMVNRTLVDADVVIPVGYTSSGDSSRQSDCVYPEFGSVEAADRLAKLSFLKRNEEIELANNTLGSFFAIQIVFRPGNEIHKVLSGARQQVSQIAQKETNELWRFEVPAAADVVVATIESETQDWSDVVESVIAAGMAAKPGSPIIIWSNIDQLPEKKIRQACQIQFGESEVKLPEKMKVFSGLVAEHPIFLRSLLKRTQIEDMGIGFLQSVDEIIRIAEPFAERLMIRDAHKCQVVLQNQY